MGNNLQPNADGTAGTNPDVVPTTQTFTQAELDRRVRQASDTARENAIKEMRDQIKAELEAEAKMTAEELAKKQLQKEREAIEQEKIANAKDRSTLAAERKFVSANFDIDKPEIRALLNNLVTDNTEKTAKNVDDFLNVYNQALQEGIQKQKEELLKNAVPPSTGGTAQKPFAQMTSAERAELKQKNPDAFKAEMEKLKKSF